MAQSVSDISPLLALLSFHTDCWHLGVLSFEEFGERVQPRTRTARWIVGRSARLFGGRSQVLSRGKGVPDFVELCGFGAPEFSKDRSPRSTLFHGVAVSRRLMRSG